MKNKHITIVALAAAALATSCASEDIAEPQKQEQNQGEPKTVTLTASVNEAQTRVGMTKDGKTAKFYWHNGDAISVLTQSGYTFSKAKFTTADETGETTAKFTCDNMTGTPFMRALYPHNDKHCFSVSGSAVTVTYNLPAEYTYTTVESNIFPKTENGETTYPSNLTNIPMVGVITGSNIAFTHLGGLAVIRIDKMPAESGTLTVTADQQLSGNFSVELSADEAKIATTTASDDNGKVTFTFSGAAENGAGVFYLPLAVGDYTNLTVE